jgi:hypothetical protein
MSSGKDEFAFVNVTITVQDINGLPVGDAEVSAFSEEWGVVYPSRDYGQQANADGIAELRIFKGNWSFFASRGSGNIGLFVVKNDLVDSNISVILRPDSTVNLSLSDFDSKPMGDIEVLVVDTNHIPMVRLPYCGTSDINGSAELEVSSDYHYDVVLIHRPAVGKSNGEAYLFHIKDVAPESNASFIANRNQLSCIRFDISNKTGAKGLHSDLEVQIPSVSLQQSFGFWRDENILWDELNLWMTPEEALFRREEWGNGWNFGFYPRVIELQANTTYDQKVGGALYLNILFHPDLNEGRQFWILVKDSFNNVMHHFTDSQGKAKMSIKLTDPINGSVIWQGELDSSVFQAFLPVSPFGLCYEVNLNLGFFGSYDFSGDVDSAMLTIVNVTTEHFLIQYPQGFEKNLTNLETYVEEAYNLMSQETGHNVVSQNPDGKIHLVFPLAEVGWSGGSTIAVALGFFAGDEAFNYPVYKGDTFKFVFGHELGHSFQGSSELEDYYIEGWFGEPFASMLSYKVNTKLCGPKIGFYLESTHWGDNFFRYLAGDKSVDTAWRTHFILAFLERSHGMEIHRNFIQLWANQTRNASKKELLEDGFSENETIAILYSSLAKENLAWLFQLAGFDITEQRVSQGLSLFMTQIIDHVLGVDGKIFHVITQSNSTVSNLVLDQSQIVFNISGDSGTVGYCNVTIPKSLMNCTTLNDWAVWVNSTQLSPPDLTATENATHTFIYFTCTFASSLQVAIKGTYVVPEFSSPVILLLSTATMLLAITVKRKHGKLSRLQI